MVYGLWSMVCRLVLDLWRNMILGHRLVLGYQYWGFCLVLDNVFVVKCGLRGLILGLGLYSTTVWSSRFSLCGLRRFVRGQRRFVIRIFGLRENKHSRTGTLGTTAKAPPLRSPTRPPSSPREMATNHIFGRILSSLQKIPIHSIRSGLRGFYPPDMG